MIKKLKKWFKSVGYMIAFGTKGANDLINQQTVDTNNIGVVEQEQTKGLGAALMKGEVTQEVEELRYRNYKVYQESSNYDYIGDGNAIKIKGNKNEERTNYTFTQNNGLICEGVGHELNRIGSYGVDRYSFDIIYSDITRFKIEAYASFGKFTIKDKNITVDFYFDKTLKNRYDPTSYGVLKELDKISKFISTYEINNNDLCSNVDTLNFTTYKANGEDDLIQYTITDMSFKNCKEYEDYYILSFESNNFTRLNLTSKYYNDVMEQKYKAKQAKDVDITLNSESRIEKCSICGSVMNVYDADVTTYEYGKPICINCLKKMNMT